MLVRGIAAGLAATLSLGLPSELPAGGEWPDAPNKAWFQGLKRPDNYKHPHRDEKSQFCCGVADTVRTKFKVEAGNERYPEDRWYAWLNDQWIPIPPEKIVQDHAPDGATVPVRAGWHRAVLCAAQGWPVMGRNR
jgi:hypothetical protein